MKKLLSVATILALGVMFTGCEQTTDTPAIEVEVNVEAVEVEAIEVEMPAEEVEVEAVSE